MENKSTIVIVDDSNTIRSFLKMQLKLNGYAVHAFGDPRVALEELESISPDIIISDVIMPEMNGVEFCRHVKHNHRLSSIPVLFLSGEDSSDTIVEGFDVGAVDYVTKPIMLEVLIARIETHAKLYRFQKMQMNRNRELENLVAAKIDQHIKSQMGTITALAKLAEYRDEDTGSHLERVEAYCELLAQKLSDHPDFRDEITNWYIKLIRYSSPLHDIGKVAIPDKVLLKPGKLTDEEFDMMKGHSRFGAVTLSKVLKAEKDNDFIQMGYDIAYYHHEKWNGTGYPKGLAGNDIPLSARIMAVADVYDALRAERCYKKGFTHEVACEIIAEGSGAHFDPRIAECFAQNHEEFAQIWDLYKETD